MPWGCRLPLLFRGMTACCRSSPVAEAQHIDLPRAWFLLSMFSPRMRSGGGICDRFIRSIVRQTDHGKRLLDGGIWGEVCAAREIAKIV